MGVFNVYIGDPWAMAQTQTPRAPGYSEQQYIVGNISLRMRSNLRAHNYSGNKPMHVLPKIKCVSIL